MTFLPKKILLTDSSGANPAQVSAAGYIYSLIRGEYNHGAGIALGSTSVLPIGGNDYAGTIKVLAVDANGRITVNIPNDPAREVGIVDLDDNMLRQVGKVILTDLGGNPIQIGSDWGGVNDLFVASCKDGSGNFGPIRSDAAGRVLVTIVDAGTDTERSVFGKVRLHDGTNSNTVEATGALDVIFKDATGALALAKVGTAHSTTITSLLMLGSDGATSPIPRAIRTDTSGRVITIPGTLVHKAISVSASGNTTIHASVASNKIKVISYALVSGGTVNVKFVDGGGTDMTGAMPLIANSGVSFASANPCMETATGSGLQINLSAAVQVSGHISYLVEP